MDLHRIVEEMYRVPKPKVPTTFERKSKIDDPRDLMLEGYIK